MEEKITREIVKEINFSKNEQKKIGAGVEKVAKEEKDTVGDAGKDGS